MELRPPLWKPGVYHFELGFEEGSQPCSFDVALGVTDAVGPSRCPLIRQLRERKVGDITSIVGMTLAESPSILKLRIQYGAELIYDTRVEPHYEDSKLETGTFCGRHAFVNPTCVPGSEFCKPFLASCAATHNCGSGKVCCISSSWGLEHGSFAASQCTPRRECDGRIDTSIACRDDMECTPDRQCSESKEGSSFRPALRTCEMRPRAVAPP
jgi:hypothetical protein